MAEMIPNHASAHRGGAVWRQRLTERDECRFDGLRRFARGCLGTPRALLRPGGFGSPIALLPLVQPTFGTAHLLTDDRNGVAVEKPLIANNSKKVWRLTVSPNLLLIPI